MPAKKNHQVTQIRIFISSPSDVQEERDALEEVIEDLERSIGKPNGIILTSIRWEKDGRPQMGNIQENLFEQLGDYEIYVGIFWNRFGIPTGKYGSGTEAEFEDAYAKWEQDHSRPVMLYFCEKEVGINPFELEEDEAMEQIRQAKRVEAFRKKVEGLGLFFTYKDLNHFKKLTHNHLADEINAWIKRHKPAESITQVVPDIASSPQVVPKISRDTYLKTIRRSLLRIPLSFIDEDDNYHESVSLDKVFIDLKVREKRPGREDQQKESSGFEAELIVPALKAIESHSRVVLLGDPGSGKSSLVKHLLADLAECERTNTAPILPDTKGLLPVLVTLRDLATRLRKINLPSRHSDREKKLAELIVDQAISDAKALGVGGYAEGIREAFLKEQVFLVLDGMDETPVADRKRVRQAAGAALSYFKIPRQIITCRIRSYSGSAVFENVPTYTLEPLNEEQITTFINNWYEAQTELNRVAMDKKESQINNLVEVSTRDPLLPLAENPMLLTTMSFLHMRHTKLPEERVKLYKLAVDLLIRRWQAENAGLPEPLKDFLLSEEKVGPALTHLAFKAHQPGEEAADLERDVAAELLSSPLYLRSKAKADMFLDYVDKRSGLLIGKGGSDDEPDTYSFPHRTFQEYLAGCYAVGAPKPVQRLRELASEGEFWSEAVTQGIQEQVMNSGNFGRDKLLTLSSLLTQNDPQNEADERVVLWAGRMAREVGADVVETAPGEYEDGKDLLKRLKGQLVKVIGGNLPPIERASVGRVLAKLGDPREEVMTIEGMRFCYVPEGPFIMGEDSNKHQLAIPYDYWIGRSPVTVAQYQSFIDDGGYNEDRFWSEAGRAWRDKNSIKGPEEYAGVFSLPNHPVVGVSWYEAHAYTKWLTGKARAAGWISKEGEIKLPNEAEWEKAARGGLVYPENPVTRPLNRLELPDQPAMKENQNKGRRYAWGDKGEPDKCNYNLTGIESTSTPGCFSRGASPYGCRDMNGNVWEWQRNKWRPPYPYPLNDKSWDDPEGDDRRVLRGGSFPNNNADVRCAGRNYGDLPGVRNFVYGFRVIALPLP